MSVPDIDGRSLALRAGVTAAAITAAGSFTRGLVPRTAADQGVLTTAAAAYGMFGASLAFSAVEEVTRRRTVVDGRAAAHRAILITALATAGGCAVAARRLPNDATTPLPLATAQSAAYAMRNAAGIAALTVATDDLLLRAGKDPGPAVDTAIAAGVGTVVAGARVYGRTRRARATTPPVAGTTPPVAGATPPAAGTTPAGTASTGRRRGRPGGALLAGARAGVITGAAVTTVALTERGTATAITKLVTRALGRPGSQRVPAVVGHGAATTLLGLLAAQQMQRIRHRIDRGGDVIEPAYPRPPANPLVTAGPASTIGFDTLGKEGRRFVLMALSAREIGDLMGEPAVDPVRIVVPAHELGADDDPVAAVLREMDALGAFARRTIVIAAPTGVGYVNYSFAEAVEYLTRGDCTIVVPQYAHVPSALALGATNRATATQAAVVQAVAARIAALPAATRPRLVQFGESLGAQVGLDIADPTTDRFTELGLDAGLYLGTPFRSALWRRWRTDPAAADPRGVLAAVPDADALGAVPPAVRHVQVIHPDDPINKFDYASVVRRPWWLSDPAGPSPGVPAETHFRPVLTFLISLADLKNGMNSKPGRFVRQGHDYRIELATAVHRVFGLPATAAQLAAIEQALRDRETEWAGRRLVARRMQAAWSRVSSQLREWNVDVGRVNWQAVFGAEAPSD